MRQPISKKRISRWCSLLFVLAIFLLFTFLPPFDRQAYLAWVDGWDRPETADAVPTLEGWPKSKEEHLAILNSVSSDRVIWQDSTRLVCTAGSRTVQKDGSQVTLHNPVRAEDGVLLVPAEETLDLLGGTFRVHGESGAIRLYLRRYNGQEYYLNEPLDRVMSVLWLEQQAVSFRGEDGPVHTPRDVPELGKSCPRYIGGALYIPAPYLCYALSLQGEWLEGDTFQMTLSGMGEDLGGMDVGQSFQTIPVSLARELRLIRGDLFNPGNCLFYNVYGNEDIRIVCTKPFSPLTPEPAAEKRIVSYTLLSPRLATSRGIRLGDSAALVLSRYDVPTVPEDGVIRTGSYGYSLCFRITDGVVTEIWATSPES